MSTDSKEIQVPLILFLDDGVYIYKSTREAEYAQEAVDVRNNPDLFGYGYDSSGSGFRLRVTSSERRVLGIKLPHERVLLIPDPTLRITEDDNARSRMQEYYLRINSATNEKEVAQMSTRDLLNRILKG